MKRLFTAGLLFAGLINSAEAQSTNSVAVETIKLDLVDPSRYQIPIILEPNLRVEVMAMSDGVVKTITTQVGSMVREGQEVAKLDQAEAYVELAITQALLKEVQAELKMVQESPAGLIAEAKVEAAQARVQKAQLVVDRCVLRAPFAGRVVAVSATAGQFIQKGQSVVEIADLATLRVLTPIERPTGGTTASAALIGKTTKLIGEDRIIEGKIEAILPLVDIFVALRDLHANLSCAWVSISNADGLLEAGTRVGSSVLPDSPITLIPSAALKTDDPRNPKGSVTPTVQILRNEYVVDVPVRLLGKAGPGRVQVCGGFRPADALIIYSKVPLVAGTLVRFSGTGKTLGSELRPPDPNARGIDADVISPVTTAGARVAPIGTPGSAAPTGGTPKTKTAPPPKAKAVEGGGGVVPF